MAEGAPPNDDENKIEVVENSVEKANAENTESEHARSTHHHKKRGSNEEEEEEEQPSPRRLKKRNSDEEDDELKVDNHHERRSHDHHHHHRRRSNLDEVEKFEDHHHENHHVRRASNDEYEPKVRYHVTSRRNSGEEGESEADGDDTVDERRRSSDRAESIEIVISDDADETDSKRSKRQANTYAAKKTVAQGMMDIALITANANQLRYLIEFNRHSSTFLINVTLIVLSLLLQVGVGLSLIFKGRMDLRGQSKHRHAKRINNYVVVGVFLVTIINVFVASFTVTSSGSVPVTSIENPAGSVQS